MFSEGIETINENNTIGFNFNETLVITKIMEFLSQIWIIPQLVKVFLFLRMKI